jgi:hypothetical protein
MNGMAAVKAKNPKYGGVKLGNQRTQEQAGDWKEMRSG